MAKIDVYAMVTERIIEDLEKGLIPWEKPWAGVKSGAFNRISKKPYSLINQMLLGKAGEWATFKQWSDLGGKIRKGEKARAVVFWKVYQKEIETDDGEKKIVGWPILKYYNVFHIDQVDGVEPLPAEELPKTDPIEAAENVIAEYLSRENLKMERCRSDKAYYSPMLDYIKVPLVEQFENAAECYSTYFHEITHSTGHYSRLNRFPKEQKIAAFGSEDYSKEELIAELGAASLCNYLGIETKSSFRNSTAYIQSWIRALKNDKTLIVSASSKAEKAVNYILNINA